MKNRILILLAGAFYHFGIVNALQQKFDCDLYAIVDVDDKPKKFYKKQQLVKFQKVWYFRDNVKIVTKITITKILEKNK